MPNGRRNPMTRTLTPDDVATAVIIDFEGRTEEPPVLLGVLEPNGAFTQYVIDDDFATAAAAKAKGTDTKHHCVYTTPARALDAIRLAVRSHGGPLVGYSTREPKAILEIEPGLEAWVGDHYVDGKATAKRWARKCRPDYEFVRRDPHRGGRYTLDQFMQLVDYRVPTGLGPGQTGQRIRFVRDQIHRRGSYEPITATAKTKWAKVLGHNLHDCLGLRAVLERSADDLADGCGAGSTM